MFGVGVGLVLAVAAGTLVAGSRAGTVAVIALVAGVAVLLTRRFSVPPPGALMPVLVGATATQIPLDAAPLATRVGLVALGAAIAWIVVMAGACRSAAGIRRLAATRGSAPPWPQILRAAARGAVGTGAAALVAVAAGAPRPDWAAVACAAVLVHDATRTTLRRAGHRAFGTAAGIGVAGLVLAVVARRPAARRPGGRPAVRRRTPRRPQLHAGGRLHHSLALLQGALATGQLDGPILGLLAGRLVETAIGCTLAVLVQAVIPPPGERPARTAVLRWPAGAPRRP